MSKLKWMVMRWREHTGWKVLIDDGLSFEMAAEEANKLRKEAKDRGRPTMYSVWDKQTRVQTEIDKWGLSNEYGN